MIEIIEVSIPALIVFLTAYFVLKTYLNSVHKNKMLELKVASGKDIIMMRLQAYERMILLIERISPDHLMMRVKKDQVSIDAFHKELIANIRAEFDHNIAQQLYISTPVWNSVVVAKETIVKILNISKEESGAEDSVINYGRLVIKHFNSEKKVINVAIEALKKEAQKLF